MNAALRPEGTQAYSRADFETVFGDVVGTTDREQLAIRNESTAAEHLTVASPVGASCFYYPHAGVS